MFFKFLFIALALANEPIEQVQNNDIKNETTIIKNYLNTEGENEQLKTRQLDFSFDWGNIAHGIWDNVKKDIKDILPKKEEKNDNKKSN